MGKNFLLILSAVSVILISFFIINNNPNNPLKNREELSFSCATDDLSGTIDFFEEYAFFEGRLVNIPWMAFANTQSNVLGASEGDKWIEVDLSEQKLYAWEGNSLFLETPVSTGLSYWPTPKGEFRIWVKLRATKMEGGAGKNYYYLPNVPYVMFFEGEGIARQRGFGLHGTYWHNDFGRPRSHGCVNLPTEIAQRLYFWTSPVLLEGKSTVFSSEANLGTRIVIHE